MSWIASISGWARAKMKKRRLRLAAEWTKSTGPLRQFVYLDEVALRSLIAARYGAETVSYTESQSTSRQVALGAGVESGVPATLKVDAQGSYQTTSARSREVHRQTTTQSLFADFLGRIKREGALAWAVEEGENLPDSGLARGDLIEVKVRLEADPMYRLGATIGEMQGLASVAAAFGTTISTTQLEAISELLRRLMIGQVPIRAAISVPSPRGAAALEERAAVSKSGGLKYLVATTDLEQYWMDTRRILFGHQEFSVLARVAVDGPSCTWSAVKVMDLISNIVPGLPDALEAALAALESTVLDRPRPETDPFRDALETYAKSLGLSPADARKSVLTAEAAVLDVRNATSMNKAFNVVRSSAISKSHALPELTADETLRQELLSKSSIDLLGASIGDQQPTPRDVINGASASYVEAEIIAIYW